jgi:hypothetical protein
MVVDNDIVAVSSRATTTIFRMASDYSSLTPLSTVTAAGVYSHDIKIATIGVNKYLIIAHYATIDIYDITTPSAPVLLNSYIDQWGGSGDKKIAVTGNLLFNSHHDADIEIINISNPAAPALIGTIEREGDAGQFNGGYMRDLAILGTNDLVVAYSYGGITITDFSNPEAPIGLSQRPSFGGYFSGVYNNGIVNVITDMGMMTVNFNQQPSEFISYETYSGRGWKAKQSGNILACGTTWGGLQLYDISNPESPIHLVNYNPAEYIDELDIDGNYLYLGTGAFWEGVWIYDITDPSNMVRVGEIPLPDEPSGIIVKNNRLYVTCKTNGFYVYDITDKSSPILLANFNNGVDYRRLDVSGNYAYVSEYYGGIHIFDISTDNPTEVIYFPIPYAGIGYSAVVKNGNYVYTEGPIVSGTTDNYLWKIDVTDPTNPQLVEQYPIPRGGWADFKIYGDLILMPREASGIQLYRFVPI